MSENIKKCRVCGKEYVACRSAKRGAGIFRWQEVACSPECGVIYLQQINKSRELSPVENNECIKHTEPLKTKSKAVSVDERAQEHSMPLTKEKL